MTDDERFEQTLLQGARRLGIRITDVELGRLQAHRRLLLRWAGKINLTTVLDPEGMAEILAMVDEAIRLARVEQKDEPPPEAG